MVKNSIFLLKICIYEIARNALKLFMMIGENFEICISEMARNALKLSTIFGEIFEISTYEWL